jgi:hypothetical protein
VHHINLAGKDMRFHTYYTNIIYFINCYIKLVKLLHIQANKKAIEVVRMYVSTFHTIIRTADHSSAKAISKVSVKYAASRQCQTTFMADNSFTSDLSQL